MATPPDAHLREVLAETAESLVNRHLDSVPIGAIGELFIGGASLAMGYFGDPRQTAERFIPNPFAQKPGERIYATGDLASWDEDGNIHFSGRADHQVKVRGFRIEPGEIASVLQRRDDVSDAVVIVHEGHSHHHDAATT